MQTTGPADIRCADCNGEGVAGYFDEVRRNQKCFNTGTPDHSVRNYRSEDGHSRAAWPVGSVAEVQSGRRQREFMDAVHEVQRER